MSSSAATIVLAPCVPEVRRRRRLPRWLVVLGVAMAIVAGLYVFRHPVLTWAGQAWEIDEPLGRADAIVVLGGGPQHRPFEAARLYHAGYASTVLIMKGKTEPTDDLHITNPRSEIDTQVLIKQGVPEAAIVRVGNGVSSTYEEALAVRDWAKQNEPARIILPTDPFHTRRVDWIFERTLGPQHVKVITHSTPTREYTAGDWWQHESGVMALQNEIVKLCYYWLNY